MRIFSICSILWRVLDLTVAMKLTFLAAILTPFMLIFHSLLQVVPGLYVLSPTDGQLVTGIVEIKGSVPEDSFSYADVSYSFEGENSSNWFLINRLDQPVHDEALALWDTTTITDGTYRVRVAVYRRDGSSDEIILEGIRVGNYTHFDEPTATAEFMTAPVESVTETVEPTAVLSPQPTALPANPASIEAEDIRSSLNSGLILAVIGMAVLGIYAFFRRAARK